MTNFNCLARNKEARAVQSSFVEYFIHPKNASPPLLSWDSVHGGFGDALKIEF
jgi:hypothetical protein